MTQKFIEGEWFYSTKEKTLTHPFASNHDLAELNLVDSEGYLVDEFKENIREALGYAVLENVEGPFGDADIFSGNVFDDETIYSIELHNIAETNMDALQQLPNVKITIVA